MSFKLLDLKPEIHQALEACGYTEATPIQSKAIPEILAGKDIVACAQTGSGKTAAFVLPALNYLAGQEPLRKPRVLILTPTRELATQITTAAAKYGKFLRFNIVSLVGGMSYDPQIRDLKRGADIIVATPGRLIDHLENKRVDLSSVDILILDEADRMLDMGFIEDVENIASVTPETRQTLLFSATVDKSIIKIVKRLLKDPVLIDLSNEKISAPKIKQTLYKAKNMHHKSRMLKHFLNDENIFKAIIFSATKINADRLAAELRDDGFAAAPLHGDLRQNVRNRTIEALRNGKIQFLVATDVAARGLDINDITHVINYDLPKFSEDYVHRIGRTGRAGKSGAAISFATAADARNLQNIERYIGQRLQVLPDNFVYAESSVNSRSDADKYSPDAMMEQQRSGGRGGDRRQGGSNRRFNDSVRSFDDKPRRNFEPRFPKPEGENRSSPSSEGDAFPSSERPRKRFDRDESRSSAPSGERRSFDRSDKPRAFGEKRSFDRSDKPARPFGEKRSFDRDDRPAKPFGENRSFDRNDREKPFGEKRSFERSDRPAKAFGEKRSFSRDEKPGRPFGERRSIERDDSNSSRPSRPFGEKRSFDRSDRPAKPFGEKRSFSRDDSRPSKPFGEKRRFDDKPGAFDQPRKRFDRDERSPKPFGEKRRFNDQPSSTEQPRKRFDREDSRSSTGKPFGEKRSFNNDSRSYADKPRRSTNGDSKPQGRSEGSRNVFERPVYEFEKRDSNPKVLYKKRVDGDAPRSRSNDGAEKSARPKFAGGKPRVGGSGGSDRRTTGSSSAARGKSTKKPFRDER
jgi:superfamily II DNA/RNA helicase